MGVRTASGWVKSREMRKVGGKRTLSRPRRIWDDIIEHGLQEMGYVRIHFIGLGQDREMGKVGGKKPLCGPRRKWDDIIEIDLQEMGCVVWTA